MKRRVRAVTLKMGGSVPTMQEMCEARRSARTHRHPRVVTQVTTGRRR